MPCFFFFLFMVWCESFLLRYSHVTFWFLSNLLFKFFLHFPTCLTSYATIYLEHFLCSFGVLNGNEKKWITIIWLTALSLGHWLEPKEPTREGWGWGIRQVLFSILANRLIQLNPTKPTPAHPPPPPQHPI